MWKRVVLAAAAASGAVAIAQDHRHRDAGQEASPLNRPAMVRPAPVAADAGAQIAPAAERQIAPAAERQIANVRSATERYRDFEVARREGWRLFGGDGPLTGEHWYLPRDAGGTEYFHGQPLDWSRPSSLMYTQIGGRRVLTGVTFNVWIGPGEPVPEGFAGAADVWHVHDFRQLIAASLDDRPVLRWLASGRIERALEERGGRARLAMVHVWVTLPNPDGPFAHQNRILPYLKLGLPSAWAQGASLAAAKGLHLATDNGCGDTMDGAFWMANVGRAVQRQLRDACAAAADHVRQGLATRDPAQVNLMAEHGWAMFDAAWQRLLTPAQKARIAAVTEHGPSDASQSHAGHR